MYNKIFTNIKNTNPIIVNNSQIDKNKYYIKNITSLYKYEKLIHKKFVLKYNTRPNDLYFKKKINEIIFNYNSHIVAQFKDYLIRGDLSEYLLKYNNLYESRILLKKLNKFYQEFSLTFPNYVILQESKYIYKNIKRKQKLINLKIEEEGIENIKFDYAQIKNNTIFTTQALDSIFNFTESGAKQFFETRETNLNLKYENKTNNNIINIINNINKFDKNNNNSKNIKLNKLNIQNKYYLKMNNNNCNECLNKNINDNNLNNNKHLSYKSKKINHSFIRTKNNISNHKICLNKNNFKKKNSFSFLKIKNDTFIKISNKNKIKIEDKKKLISINKKNNNLLKDKFMLSDLLYSTTCGKKIAIRTFQGLNSYRDLNKYFINKTISDKKFILNNCKSKSKSKNKNSQTNIRVSVPEKNIPYNKYIESNNSKNIKPALNIYSYCHKKYLKLNLNNIKKNNSKTKINMEKSNSKNKTTELLNIKSLSKSKINLSKKSRNIQNSSKLNNVFYTTTYMKNYYFNKIQNLKYNSIINKNFNANQYQKQSYATINTKIKKINSLRNNENINIKENLSEKSNNKPNYKNMPFIKKNNSNIINLKKAKFKSKNQSTVIIRPKISNIKCSRSMKNFQDINIIKSIKANSRKKINNKLKIYIVNSRNNKNIGSSSSKSKKKNNISNNITNNFSNVLYYTNYSITPFKKNDNEFSKFKNNFNFKKINKNIKINSPIKCSQNIHNDIINNLINNNNHSKNERILYENGQKIKNSKLSFSQRNNSNLFNFKNNSNKSKQYKTRKYLNKSK